MGANGQRIILTAYPKGMPGHDELKLQAHDYPSPGQGEVLVKVIYLSLDPYMRGRMSPAKSYAVSTEIGGVVTAEAVCSVLESGDASLSAGDIVLARTGWQSHAVMPADACRKLDPSLTAKQGLTALLHDSPEYVIGDMISPFKALLGEGYKAVEARLQEAIHIRFGLPPVTPAKLKKLVKKADMICAWFEATQLAGFEVDEANRFFGEPPEGIRLRLAPKAVPDAQEAFLARFRQLMTEMGAP